MGVLKFTKMPVKGQVVDTIDGPAEVLMSRYLKDVVGVDQHFASSIRSKMGDGYERSYFQVDVVFGDNTVKTYHCWEISFDADKDDKSPPWR